MGLLFGEKSEYLAYEESRKYQRMLKSNGAKQLALLLQRFASFQKTDSEALKFGTETETHLLHKKILNGQTFYPVNISRDHFISKVAKQVPELDLKGEFVTWMLEILPSKPFESYLSLKEIRNHFFIMQKMAKQFKEHSYLIAGLSCLPHIGTLHYYFGENDEVIPMSGRADLNDYSRSDSFLDATITPHPRYLSSVVNKIARLKKDKPLCFVPLFQDKNTAKKELVLDHVAYGTSCTSLQVTFSCKNLTEARWAYDQLHVLSPFMLTLSGSTFAAHNYLIDIDNRSIMLHQSCDERSPGEMKGILKSRFNTSNYFISDSPKCKGKLFNDAKYSINKKFAKQLKHLLKCANSDLASDRRMINHFAYLFVREYLTVFRDRLIKDNVSDTLEFELMQVTNWQSMRLKPPPSFSSNLGWLLEFRCMDCPTTEKEKSALTFLLTLFMRIITDPKMDVDFYMKISQVDANFESSYKRESLTKGKFFFRKHFCKLLDGIQNDYSVVAVTMAEFLEGSSNFLGMKKLFAKFIELNSDRLKEENVNEIWSVFDFFVARAKGEILALPAFGRAFVQAHPEYKGDSILSDKIVTDLIEKIIEIQESNNEPSMFGNHLQ